MNEEIEMLVCLVGLMCFMLWQYPKNYWLNGLWILGISWYCAYIMANTTIIIFPLIVMLVTIVVNLFLIVENKVVKNK